MAYVDESGDPSDPAISGTHTYTLGCVLVAAHTWPDTFDGLIEFRRSLRDGFGIPVRAEIKANYLIHNHGPFRRLRLSEVERGAVYQQSMQIQSTLGLQTFAVVIHKDRLARRNPLADPRAVAWEYLFQRLERCRTEVLLIHDEGETAIVRKLARKARRAGTAGSAFGTGSLQRPARLLLDDPTPRDSRQSYFLQLADLSAFAAFRRLYPPPPARQVEIVPQSTWGVLGMACYSAANQLVGGIPGIVSWPRE